MRATTLTSAVHPTISIPSLRRGFAGQVIDPGDDGYDRARTVFFGGHDQRPAVIVRPTGATGVAQVVDLARETGLELAVRSGGHSTAGHSTTSGGILLDLSAMKALDIDPARRIARAQTGLTTGEYTTAAAEYGLATGFGDTGSVGLGGITLGGGIGYLVRKHGLSIDSLLAAEMVAADGRVVRTDRDHHPELFWAIRGGGGNFGVATRLEFRLHPVGTVLGGMLVLPATPEVIAGFVAEAEAASEQLSTIANVIAAPPLPFVPEELHGRPIVMAMLCWAGETEAGQRALAPFRALAEPIADMVRAMPYPGMFPPADGDRHPHMAGRIMFVNQVDEDVAGTILSHLQAPGAGMRGVELRVLGGAMARVPVEATAFAHRHRRIMVNVVAFTGGPEERATGQAWVDGFAAALEQGDGGAYVNFLGDEGPARVRAAYPGSTWDRLVAVKRRWDPDNLFRRNQNIPPGLGGR
jgi:FAD/FMN-containing dehydrogenase